MKKVYIIVVVIVLAVIAAFIFWPAPQEEVITDQKATGLDYKNATYNIEGDDWTLVNGLAEENIYNSSDKIVLKYFGYETTGDLDGDGLPDIAFILTYSTGGTGTFYIVVAALKTAEGYVGTNGIGLGDRIAPQTTTIKNGLIIVNYADRRPNEGMATQPSVGKSKYLRVVGNKLIEEIRNSQLEADDIVCTMEAKICPDGTAVGRVAPKCEFAPCPEFAK